MSKVAFDYVSELYVTDTTGKNGKMAYLDTIRREYDCDWLRDNLVNIDGIPYLKDDEGGNYPMPGVVGYTYIDILTAISKAEAVEIPK